MIYSKRKNFIFIHVYKTAGTSLRKALKPYNDTFRKRRFLDNFFYTQFWKETNFGPPGHITALNAKKLLGEDIWNKAYSFAVVRNPWDWQVSLFTYMLKVKKHPQHKLISSFKTFDDYIEWRCNNDFHTQLDFLTDESGDKIIVKDIYKLESINQDLKRLESYISCDIKLKKLNKSRSDSYRNYYSNKSKVMIQKFFSKDIERFGYEF